MNDNIMSMEEIEKMLKGAGQIDEDAGTESEATAESEAATTADEASTSDIESDAGSVADEVPSSDDTAEAVTDDEDVDVDENDKSFNTYEYLTKEEEDVLGEIGNICMGTSATTMCSLLGRRVDITTPRVSIHNPKSLARGYKAPMVVVDVNYVQGITGKNLLILDEYDVALMTDALMGGDGSDIDRGNVVLDEMHMSAIREVMNQMVGSSATSLANIINDTVDISTPSAHHISLDENEIRNLFTPTEMLVKISFDMVIEGLLDSKIMQILPLEFAKKMADKLIGGSEQNDTDSASADEIPMDNVIKNEHPNVEQIQAEHAASAAPTPAPAPASRPTPAPAPSASMGMGGMAMATTNNVVRSGVNAQEVEYPSFDSVVGPGYAPVPENIALLSNVPMRVTVQLGKAKKKVKEILEFNNGSVIVLDKLAGEPVDVLVNGKHIAKGEVVVVDDNYGVRITEIYSAAINETI